MPEHVGGDNPDMFDMAGLDGPDRPLTPRPRRYELRAPLRFRTPGAADWREGQTANVSHNGVLFFAAADTPLSEPLEFTFPLPGQGSAEVTCLGHVVRIVRPDGEAGPYGIAARIDRYRLDVKRLG